MNIKLSDEAKDTVVVLLLSACLLLASLSIPSLVGNKYIYTDISNHLNERYEVICHNPHGAIVGSIFCAGLLYFKVIATVNKGLYNFVWSIKEKEVNNE